MASIRESRKTLVPVVVGLLLLVLACIGYLMSPCRALTRGEAA